MMGQELDKIKAHLTRRADSYIELARALDMKRVESSIKQTRGRGGIGKKMIKAGIALIAVPDPITDIPGLFLLAGGYLASKFWESAGIDDIRRELNRALSCLKDI